MIFRYFFYYNYERCKFVLISNFLFASLKIELKKVLLYGIPGMLPRTLIAFGTAHMLSGNGFLAAYIAGLVAGNRNYAAKRTVSTFQDGMDVNRIVAAAHASHAAKAWVQVAAF